MAAAPTYITAVFYFGLTTTQAALAVQLRWHDKVLHFVVFAGMQLILYRLIKQEFYTGTTRQAGFIATITTCMLGGLLEILQGRLPLRSADWLDFLADILGAMSSFALVLLYLRRNSTQTGAGG